MPTLAAALLSSIAGYFTSSVLDGLPLIVSGGAGLIASVAAFVLARRFLEDLRGH